MSYPLFYWGAKMIEKNYKKKFEFQKKLISRQSEQIESLKLQVEKLELENEEKDKIINSVSFLRDELSRNISEVKIHEKEYKELIAELRKMKETMNKTVYKGRWNLIKFLIK